MAPAAPKPKKAAPPRNPGASGLTRPGRGAHGNRKGRATPVARLPGLLLTLLLIPACRGQERGDDSGDGSLPGPQRAAAAAARVTPLLAPALREKKLRVGDPVFLRGFKEEKQLELWMRPRGSDRFVLFRSYPVAATSGKPGPKLAEGDRQVPEGFYYFSRRGLKPDSRFHLAMNIGYPNAHDRHHGRTGSFIMIHGNRVSIGCLAMTDPKIEEIYTLCDAALAGGQPFIRVHLFPFRMTDERMEAAAGHRWIDFWHNLRQGHDWFERKRIPPETLVEQGRYTFRAGTPPSG